MTTGTDRLAKHYDALAPEARFVLAVNAQLRGDHAEADRLIESSRTVTRYMPDISGRAAAFSETLSAQWVLRLEAAGMLYRSIAFSHAGDDFREPQLRAARAFAHTLVAHREAWRLFCAEQGIDGADRQATGSGGDLVASAERMAEDVQFGADEMLAFVREEHPDREAVPTAADRARELREFFEERLRYWRAD